jgi:hypothetical protein
MKQTKNILLGLTLSFALFSCSKSDNSKTVLADCQLNNYGTLALSFTNSTYQHKIVVSEYQTARQVRNKVSNYGTLNDTLHLTPGRYNISIVGTKGGFDTTPVMVDKTIAQCDIATYNNTLF